MIKEASELLLYSNENKTTFHLIHLISDRNIVFYSFMREEKVEGF